LKILTIIKSVGESDLDILWELFKEFHSEVSIYSGERPLPAEGHFKSFWRERDRHSIILFLGQAAIGFALMQRISPVTLCQYLEVGAVFVKKEHRKGVNGLKLYWAILNYGREMNLPIGSEIAKENDASIAIARLLAKRNIRQKGEGRIEETKLDNGRCFFIFHDS